MKKRLAVFLFLTLVCCCLLVACQSKQSNDIAEAYSDLNNAICYEKAEYGVKISLPADVNPYDSEQVSVSAYIESPDGKSYSVPMFYYLQYQRRLVGSREELYACGDEQFRFRFTPRAQGEYKFYIKVVQNGVVTRFPSEGHKTFYARGSSKDGFLRVAADNRHLQFDNGASFVGIGNNFCGWEWAGVDNMGGTFDYDRWFGNLAANGANMTQFDFSEGDQLEWTKAEGELEWSDEYNGLAYFNQKTAFKADYKAELCDRLGLYYRLTLFHWEDFDTETDSFPDWGWMRNPYNVVNGGPTKNVADFFVNEQSKRYVKNFLRYVVARYGYSSSLMMYELFNEVDAPDMSWGVGENYDINRSKIAAWHQEMAAYIKSIDPYGHMVTTSCAGSANGGEFWAIDDIDVTTFHRYTMYNGGGNEMPYETVKALSKIISRRLANCNKPVVAGEFALSPGGDVQREYDKQGVVFHNSLYAALFSGSFGTAMSWNWGSYVDEYELYSHYRGVNLLFANENLCEATYFDNLNTPRQAGGLWYMGLFANGKTFLWLKDSLYDYDYVKDGYNPQQIASATLSVPVGGNGTYVAEFIDTYSGRIISSQQFTSADNKVSLTCPAFQRDIAVKIVPVQSYYQSYDMYSGNDEDGHVPLSSYTLQKGDSVTLYAAGYDIGGTADSGRYAYVQVSGDFTYTVRLDKTNYSQNGAKAGIMVRDNLASSAKSVFVGSFNNCNYIALQRLQAGMPSKNDNYGFSQMGMFLKVRRNGNSISTYVSADGVSYDKVSQADFKSLADQLYVGVMACNKNTLGYNKAEFSHICLIEE